MKIPWTRIKSDPVICEISNVFIVLKPKTEVPYNELAEKLKNHTVKMNDLEKYELMKKAEAEQRMKEGKKKEITSEKDPGFVAKLVETIINNLQIRLMNVHIRYEDTQVRCLEKLTMFSRANHCHLE